MPIRTKLYIYERYKYNHTTITAKLRNTLPLYRLDDTLSNPGRYPAFVIYCRQTVPASAYTYKILSGTEGDVTADAASLNAGTYKIQVNPTDLNAYKSTVVDVVLPQVSYAEATVIPYSVYVTLNKVEAPVEYVILSGSVTNLPADYESVSMVLYNEEGASVASGIDHVQYMAVKDNKNYRLVYTFKDGDGVEATSEATLNSTKTSWSFVFNAAGNTQTTTTVEVVNGVIAEEINKSIGQGDALYVPASTTVATSEGEAFNGSFEVVREAAEETETDVRVYTGTPNGLQFSPAFQLAFADNWGGELGEFTLQYLNGTNWENEDAVAIDNGNYVMNIAHFSSFRSRLVYDPVVATATDSVSSVTTVDKVNSSDQAITVHFDYTYRTGYNVESVDAAVRAAGFTNANAIAYVTDLVNTELAALGIPSVSNMTEATGSQNIEVAPNYVLSTVTKTEYSVITTLSITIDGKTVTVKATSYNRVDITNDQVSYGHGHGHGHGGDLNAGGGIVEAE